MKPTTKPRPSPRTLAAAPSAASRAPVTSQYAARFPALSVVLAGGVVLPACADPVCGTTRADELETHGRASARAASGGEASRALRELGIAVGVVTHDRTTVPEPQVAGAATPVQPMPPPPVQQPVPPPDMVPSGGVAPVQPHPVPQPPIPPGQTTRPTPSPQPPAIPRPGGRMPVNTHPTPQPPQPQPAVPGGVGAVGPLPSRSGLPVTRRA